VFFFAVMTHRDLFLAFIVSLLQHGSYCNIMNAQERSVVAGKMSVSPALSSCSDEQVASVLLRAPTAKLYLHKLPKEIFEMVLRLARKVCARSLLKYQFSFK
jgi:hypothetical protein